MATILIVDDHPTNREFLVTLLGYQQHRLLEAADGVEGLNLARIEHPDLVIADILMPTMDGYEFVSQLRADPQIAQTPVIFYTATYLEREAYTLAQTCGVAHILTKPSEPEEVLRTVEAALSLSPLPVKPIPAAEFDREHVRLMTDKLSQKMIELQAVNQRLAALIDLSQHLGLEGDPRRILEKACQASRTIIGAKYATIGVLNEDGQSLRYFLTSGLDAESAAAVGPSAVIQDLVAQLLTQGRPIRLRDLAGNAEATGLADTSAAAHQPALHSFLGAPVTSPTQLYGWLYLGNKVGAAEFSDEDEQVIVTIAAQVAVAYENEQRHEKIRHHADELEQKIAERKRAEVELKGRARQQAAVAELGQRALVTPDPSILMEDAMTLITETLQVEYGKILELQADGQALLLRAGAGWQKGYVKHALVSLTPDSAEGTLLAGSGPVVVEDWRIETHFAPPALLSDHEVISSVGVIIHGQEQPFGILGADTRQRRIFTEDDTDFLQTMANILATAIERRRAEGELQNAEAKYRTLVEQLPAISYIAAMGQGSRIIYISPQVKSLLGFSQAEWLAKPDIWRRQLHPDDRERVIAEVQRVDASGEPLNIEYRLLSRQGQVLWFRNQTVPVRDQSGKIRYVHGIMFDITENKRLEEQLIQAQKMEAIGRLAGGVAHDFNNLLLIINGYSELILHRHLADQNPLQGYIEEILKAGERATGLTRQLLAFSRKQVLQPEILNLNQVIMDVEKMLQRLIGEDIELITAPAADLGRVKADPGQLEQVIMNLAVNARDAMPQGGKLIIETANVELDESYASHYLEVAPGPYVLLAVHDTGTGMSAETLSHLFEPFFTTKDQGKGTGLGLATVYGIIKQSGGHVKVYSELEQGTSFKIYLPRNRDTTAPVEPMRPHGESPLGSETILVVEDESSVRELVHNILTEKGYTVLQAGSGPEALRLYEYYSEPIHLLLTDMIMPGGLNGRDLAERLQPLYPNMKVLYMSGYTDNAIIQHEMLEPGTDFLQKPFVPDDLEHKVRELLSVL